MDIILKETLKQLGESKTVLSNSNLKKYMSIFLFQESIRYYGQM